MKPVVSWYFWGPFRKKAPESIKKALGLSVKLDTVLRLCKTPKTVSKTRFPSIQKSCPKYLINPVVYWYFWGPFCKMAPGSIKKALGLSVKVECVFRLCKTAKTFSKTTFWSIGKRWPENLINPVVYWYFWGPFRKKALKSIRKALPREGFRNVFSNRREPL